VVVAAILRARNGEVKKNFDANLWPAPKWEAAVETRLKISVGGCPGGAMPESMRQANSAVVRMVIQ
jgi:hypothetical protein